MIDALIALALAVLSIVVDWLICGRVSAYYVPRTYTYQVDCSRLVALVFCLEYGYWSVELTKATANVPIWSLLPVLIGISLYFWLVVRQVKAALIDPVESDRYGL